VFTVLCLIALFYMILNPVNDVEEYWWEDEGCEDYEKTDIWTCEE
jgi:hypothetical protein